MNTIMKSVKEFLSGISQDDFNKILDDNEYVIVDCFAEWCGPCQRMKPIFKELAEDEQYKNIEFVTIDTDKCNWINNRFDIDSIPRFLFFKNGKLIHEQRGASNKDAFEFVIKDRLLGMDFDTFKSFESLSKNEYENLIKEEKMAVIYVQKDGSQLNDIFKPMLVMASQEHDIYFASISYDKNSWIKNEFGIIDEEYRRYGEPEKKLPYFLFYKDGSIVKEMGAMTPEQFDSIIKGEMLNLIKVAEYEKGISKEEFEKILSENKRVMVDIFTTWCGPCKMMKPIFQDLSTKYEQVKFISTDLDETRWLGSHKEWGTDAIPTFLLFKEGKMVKKHVGGMSKDKFEELIKEKLLKD